MVAIKVWDSKTVLVAGYRWLQVKSQLQQSAKWAGLKCCLQKSLTNVTCQGKAKQRCVMGVGMCLYAQLVQTKNKQCKSAIILQCYHPHLSDFRSRPRLTQPYNHNYNISWCCQNLSSLLLKVSVVVECANTKYTVKRVMWLSFDKHVC